MIAWLALIVALLSGVFSAYVYLEQSKKLRPQDVAKKLEESSDELSKNYERRLKGIEMEWENMYEKFSRIMGRAERIRALAPPENKPETEPQPLTHSDILRRFRGRK